MEVEGLVDFACQDIVLCLAIRESGDLFDVASLAKDSGIGLHASDLDVFAFHRMILHLFGLWLRRWRLCVGPASLGVRFLVRLGLDLAYQALGEPALLGCLRDELVLVVLAKLLAELAVLVLELLLPAWYGPLVLALGAFPGPLIIGFFLATCLDQIASGMSMSSYLASATLAANRSSSLMSWKNSSSRQSRTTAAWPPSYPGWSSRASCRCSVSGPWIHSLESRRE